jgi:hypothetical protein
MFTSLDYLSKEKILKTHRDNRKFLQILGAKHLIAKMSIVVSLSLMLFVGLMSTNNGKQAEAATHNTSAAYVTQVIREIFGPHAAGALRVAQCESGLNPNAVNSIWVGNSRAQGVFQILYPSTWAGTSQAGASPFNIRANVRAAYEIFVRDGYSWREWVCQP